jgi:hypothetical protein
MQAAFSKKPRTAGGPMTAAPQAFAQAIVDVDGWL